MNQMKLIRRGYSGSDRRMPYVEITGDPGKGLILADKAVGLYSNADGKALTLRQIQDMGILEEMDIRYRSK